MSEIIKRKKYEKIENLKKSKKSNNNIFIFTIIAIIILMIGLFFSLSAIKKEDKATLVENEVFVDETIDEVFERMDKEYINQVEELGVTNREEYYKTIRSEYE